MLLYCTDAPIFKIGERYYALGLANIIKRYSNFFGPIALFARLKPTPSNFNGVDITDCLLPGKVVTINNLIKSLLPSSNLKKQLKNLIQESSVVAIRTPALSAKWILKSCIKERKPVLAEVMGCPWDSNWNHSLKGKFIAPYMWLQTKQVVSKANYSHYVTEKFLQHRYPSSCLQLAVSDVIIKKIDNEIISNRMKKIQNMDNHKITLMTSAACNVRYKGQQYVIEAISRLRKQGIEAHYSICGGGDNSYLKSIAKKYKVEDLVDFKGRLSLEDINKELDKCDIYVQPSLQEGLPRSVVEAMSRGCPVIGARTGGIPELISEECIAERKSVDDIVRIIIQMLNNGLQQYAEENIKKAKEFDKELLEKKFNDFYQTILEQVE